MAYLSELLSPEAPETNVSVVSVGYVGISMLCVYLYAMYNLTPLCYVCISILFAIPHEPNISVCIFILFAILQGVYLYAIRYVCISMLWVYFYAMCVFLSEITSFTSAISIRTLHM